MSLSFQYYSLLPLLFDDPSAYKVYVSSSNDDGGNSTMKLARDCALIVPFGLYFIPNSESSIDHATILPGSSGFLKTFAIGQSVLTII